MASLKDATQLTGEIENLLGDLRNELEEGDVDFDKLVSLSDQIGERADGMAETFSTVNDALMQRLQDVKSGRGNRSDGSGSQASKSPQRSRSPRRRSKSGSGSSK